VSALTYYHGFYDLGPLAGITGVALPRSKLMHDREVTVERQNMRVTWSPVREPLEPTRPMEWVNDAVHQPLP
jgi:hypothetical protein